MISLLLLLLNVVFGYYPVIHMHGINDDYQDTIDTEEMIKKYHPGTVYYSINAYNDEDSITTSLGDQLVDIIDIVKRLTITNSTFADGYHLFCHSQGALLCRALIEEWDDHKVINYISAAGLILVFMVQNMSVMSELQIHL